MKLNPLPGQVNARDQGPGHGQKQGSVPDQGLGLDLWNTAGLRDWKRNTRVVVKVLDTSPQVSLGKAKVKDPHPPPGQENTRDPGPGHGHRQGSVPDQGQGLDLWNTHQENFTCQDQDLRSAVMGYSHYLMQVSLSHIDIFNL